MGAAILVAVTGIVPQADRSGPLMSLLIEVIFLTCAILFSKLTIKIDSETLQACFATGFICKKVLLAEIAERAPIRIHWWHGWGIHVTPYGWLCNVSGLDAVAITLRDGRKLAFGTDDPDGLVAAIRHSISTG